MNKTEDIVNNENIINAENKEGKGNKEDIKSNELTDKYNTIPLLAVVFLFLIISVTILIYVIYNLNNLPKVTETYHINPDDIPCNEADVLDAYVFDYPSKPNCPPWTNNFLVDNDYYLYEKELNDNGCCGYSNNPSDRYQYENPWICVGNSTGYKYTVSELNQKPYLTNGNSVTYITPQCVSGTHTDGCISLIKATGYLGLNVYKILNLTNVESRSSSLAIENKCNTVNRYNDYIESLRDVVGGNSTGDLLEQIRGLDFYLNPQCQSLDEIYYYGKLIGKSEDGEFKFIDFDPIPVVIPPLAQVVADIFNRNGFAPIAGVNPPASELAAQNVYQS